MADLTLSDIKLYLRVDNALEDALLTNLLASATQFVKEQAGKSISVSGGENKNIEEDVLFQTAVQMLVQHWYDNRGVVAVGASQSTWPYALRSIIHHIALNSEYV